MSHVIKSVYGDRIWGFIVKPFLVTSSLNPWHSYSTGRGQRLVPGEAEDAAEVEVDEEQGEEEPPYLLNGAVPPSSPFFLFITPYGSVILFYPCRPCHSLMLETDEFAASGVTWIPHHSTKSHTVKSIAELKTELPKKMWHYIRKIRIMKNVL